MRSVVFISAILFTFCIIGCGGNDREQSRVEVRLEEASISLEGMKCQMCASFVQQAAKKVPGVAAVDVDLNRKTGTVSYNPEETSLSAIEIAIADAGYTANETKRNETAYAQLPDCCK